MHRGGTDKRHAGEGEKGRVNLYDWISMVWGEVVVFGMATPTTARIPPFL